MQTRVGLALAVMMAIALGHVVEGRKEQMSSLVKPVPIAASGYSTRRSRRQFDAIGRLPKVDCALKTALDDNESYLVRLN